MNGAVHALNQAVHDGEAEAGSGVRGPRVAALLRKRLVDMLEKFRLHADAGIRDNRAVEQTAVLGGAPLLSPVDASAGTGVFDRVFENVLENLLKADRAAVDERKDLGRAAAFVHKGQTLIFIC